MPGIFLQSVYPKFGLEHKQFMFWTSAPRIPLPADPLKASEGFGGPRCRSLSKGGRWGGKLSLGLRGFKGLGFGVWGLGFGGWGLGFRVWGLGFRV